LSSGTSLFIWPFHSAHNFPCRFYVRIYEYPPKYDHFWSTSPLNYLKPIRLCFCDELFHQWVCLTDVGHFCTIWAACNTTLGSYISIIFSNTAITFCNRVNKL
jgi:hypothetical protein